LCIACRGCRRKKLPGRGQRGVWRRGIQRAILKIDVVEGVLMGVWVGRLVGSVGSMRRLFVRQLVLGQLCGFVWGQVGIGRGMDLRCALLAG
jgi:hypothetical protein